LLGGKTEDCRLQLDTLTHQFSDKNQQAMVRFFNQHTGKPEPAPDRPIQVPDEAQLQVTPECDVLHAGSRPIYEMVAERAHLLATSRQPIDAEHLPALVQSTLAIQPPVEVPHHRRLFLTEAVRECTGQHVYRFLVESEPGVPCLLRHICRVGNPFRLSPEERTVLYLPDIDSQEELEDPEIMAGEDAYWMLDVRGLGEGLSIVDDPLNLYGHEYMFTGFGLMYGRPLLGLRVFDVLSAVRLLRSEGAREIHLIGRRQGAVLALLSAVLDQKVATVTCLDAPDSFLHLATAPYTCWPAVNFPHAILQKFDFADVRCMLGERLIKETTVSPIIFPPLRVPQNV
jgi:hypothetical protein